MPILQHYYTSYTHQATGRSGWQTKAMSRRMTPELETTIKGLINYKYPPSLDATDIQSHPVSLRYSYDQTRRGFLICCQSTGADNYGRPGNFFAHTLVLPPEYFEDLALLPPILFWKSPTWCKEDQRAETELPTLFIQDLEEGLDIQHGVWDFLAAGERRVQLASLLSALIQRSQAAAPRIIILDQDQHIAWWIASVSLFLPPAYRPWLSFSTYQHAPFDGRYMITGTTREWWQRVASNPQFANTFVLNADASATQTNQQPSAYAELIASITSLAAWKQELLPLFQSSARHFPPRDRIDQRLELFALYVKLLKRATQPDQAPVSAGELQALEVVLNARGPEEGVERQELVQLQRILMQAANAQDAHVLQSLEQIRQQLGQDTPIADTAPARPARSDAALPELLTSFTLAYFSLKQLDAYRQALNISYAVPLPEAIQFTLPALLALLDGRITPEQASHLSDQVQRLSPVEYQHLTMQCLTALFAGEELSPASQTGLLNALFLRDEHYARLFWQAYWDTLRQALTRPAGARLLLHILDFWFNVPSENLRPRYLLQEYLLYLPERLEDLCNDRMSAGSLREFQALVQPSHYWWYSSIQPFLQKERSVASLKRFFLGQKRESMVNQEFRNSESGRTIERLLLSEEQSPAALNQEIQELYLHFSQGPETFWQIYWSCFQELIVAHQHPCLVRTLDGWFNQPLLQHQQIDALKKRQVVISFFLGLPLALESLNQGRYVLDFRAMADEINNLNLTSQVAYPWAELLLPFLTRKFR